MSQYNFVILGSKNEIFKMSFRDVAKREDVVYLDDDISHKSFVYKLIHRIHFSRVVNKFFQIPLKNIWNGSKVVFSFDNTKPICFILFTNFLQNDSQTKIFYFLKNKYP